MRIVRIEGRELGFDGGNVGLRYLKQCMKRRMGYVCLNGYIGG